MRTKINYYGMRREIDRLLKKTGWEMRKGKFWGFELYYAEKHDHKRYAGFAIRPTIGPHWAKDELKFRFLADVLLYLDVEEDQFDDREGRYSERFKENRT